MILTVPFLASTDFNTKGEPREALIVFSMTDGNWIFPFSENGDIPYKPPFFHWCILLVSELTGHVNEFSSRLPSALAFSVMVFCIALIIKDRKEGFLSGLILLSMFETHRAAMACRVDMMLATCMTVALCSLFSWTKAQLRGFPILAVIGMSFAMLTKGPVGIVLPCLVGVIFAMLGRKQRSTIIIKRYLLIFLVSLVIPLAWYCKAYSIVGDDFLRLVAEENLGRFFSRMSYESHNGPFFMPFLFLLAGTLPYSLLLLTSTKTAVKRIRDLKGKDIKLIITGMRNRFMFCSPLMQFSILTIAVVTIFYCIPGSKRSVYLLPAYPFIAYVLSIIIMKTDFRILMNFSRIIMVVCCMISAIVIALMYFPIQNWLSAAGADNEIMKFLSSFLNVRIGFFKFLILLLPIIAVIIYFCIAKFREIVRRIFRYIPAVCGVLMYLMIDSIILPVVLNSKSDKYEAEAIVASVPRQQTIYSYCDAPMMRFFAINFYTRDRVRPFALSPAEIECNAHVSATRTPPEDGYILIADKDIDKFKNLFGKDYTLSTVYRSKKKGCDVRDFYGLYRFRKI